MPDLKIAVMVSNLKMDPYEGFKVIAEMGVPGVHLSVGSGPFAPAALDTSGRKALVDHLKGMGLEISALSSWGGKVDLCEEEGIDAHIEDGKRTLELAADLGCGIWQAHIGIMPRDAASPRWATLVDAAGQIAAHGEKVGACLSIETGPEPPRIVKRLIETVGSVAVRVNYDPANLIIWPALLAARSGNAYDKEEAMRDFEPVEGVTTVGPYIVHTHAKDALVQEDGVRKEVPLGTGWVEWDRYISLLGAQGYDGYYAIERETGEDPVGDIRRAVDFLRSL